MNAEFFALAFSTVLNPKVLGIDLLLIANSRPRMMFLCFLLGGIGMSVTVGLLDVLVLHVDAVNAQRSVSAGIDLAVGLVLIAVGWLVATRRIRRRQPVAVGADAGPAAKKDGWAERNLREPRPGLAVVIGAFAGTPGAAYATALKHLVTGAESTSAQVVAVLVFNVIQWSPVIIPLAFLELWPDATARRLRGISEWLVSHARQLIAGVAMVAGAYMAITGLAHLV